MIYTLKISGVNSAHEAVLWIIGLPLTKSEVTLECEIAPRILPDLTVEIGWNYRALDLDLTTN